MADLASLRDGGSGLRSAAGKANRISSGLPALAGGTPINQAAAIEAYRLLSMQIGAGASLLTKPVEQGRFNEKSVAPTLLETVPLHRVNAIADTALTPTGSAIIKKVGTVAGAGSATAAGRSRSAISAHQGKTNHAESPRRRSNYPKQRLLQKGEVEGPSDEAIRRRRDEAEKVLVQGSRNVTEVYNDRDKAADEHLAGRGKIVTERLLGPGSRPEHPRNKAKP